ncbi:MAG TPA: molecular chaperone [Clostridiales bacterium]|nr:molecular chaperone [Clostridiales bacterium]
MSENRHELKHPVSPADFQSIRHRLRWIAKPDPHTGPEGGYLVRSLYFDNIQDMVLQQKLDGVDPREKFRIRFYDMDTRFIRIEKKSRSHGLCSKTSFQVTREECKLLLAGDLTWMRFREESLALELYSKMHFQQLKPRTLVEYWREAFTYPAGDVRITLDSRIRTGLNALDLFNPAVPLVPAGSDRILEVKYGDYFPDIIQGLVCSKYRQATAFSKYAVCRSFL